MHCAVKLIFVPPNALIGQSRRPFDSVLIAIRVKRNEQKKMERQNEIDAIVRSWCRQFDALVFVFIIDTASQIVYQNSTR